MKKGPQMEQMERMGKFWVKEKKTLEFRYGFVTLRVLKDCRVEQPGSSSGS